jgi:hypothetical protein
MKGLSCTLTGIVPLLMHNGALANPLNPYAKSMAQITRKRHKTEEDYAELAKLEWTGSLYLAEHSDLGPGIHVVIPGGNIKSMIWEAAKTQRRGKQVKAGVFCPGPFPLHFSGSAQSPQELWETGEYALTSTPSIRGNRVIRTRPQFFPWALRIKIFFNAAHLSIEDIQSLVQIAGYDIGLGDWRPEYGRFEAAHWSDLGEFFYH